MERIITRLVVEVDGKKVDVANKDYGQACAALLAAVGVSVPEVKLTFYPTKIEETESGIVLIKCSGLGYNGLDPFYWIEGFARGYLGQGADLDFFEKAGAAYRSATLKKIKNFKVLP